MRLEGIGRRNLGTATNKSHRAKVATQNSWSAVQHGYGGIVHCIGLLFGHHLLHLPWHLTVIAALSAFGLRHFRANFRALHTITVAYYSLTDSTL
jgi:hypothetical protein